MRFLITLFLLWCSLVIFGQNSPPVIKVGQMAWDSLEQYLKISYALSDAENDQVDVRLGYYLQNQLVWLAESEVSGDVGLVASGSEHELSIPRKVVETSNGTQWVLLADDWQLPEKELFIEQVSKINLETHVRFLEGERSSRTKKTRLHHQNVRDYIQERFQSFSLPVTVQDTTMSLSELLSVISGESGGSRQQFPVVNIVGSKQGTLLGQHKYMLAAHYDTSPKSPGVNDNATGVAALLEIARILSNYTFLKSISFAALDQEEQELLGAGSLVFGKGGLKNDPHFEGLINLDMIGAYSDKANTQKVPEGFDVLFPENYNRIKERNFSGDFALIVSNENSLGIGNSLERSDDLNFNDLYKELLVLDGMGESNPYFQRGDHFPFWVAGLKAIHVTDGAETRYKHYHSKNDTFDKVNFDFVRKVTQMVLLGLYENAKPCHCGVSQFFTLVDSIPGKRKGHLD